MRYLRSRSHFITEKNAVYHESKPIGIVNEAFENSITWGGSLIGRLINSYWRRSKIKGNEKKVDGLLEELETMLLDLLEDESSFKDKNTSRDIRMRMLLYHLHRVSVNKAESIEARLRILLSLADYNTRRTTLPGPVNASYAIGDGLTPLYEADEATAPEGDDKKEKEAEEEIVKSGLIDFVIKDVEKSKIEKRDELLEKLQNYKRKLMEIPPQAEGDDQKEKKNVKSKFAFYSATKSLLEGYLDVLRQIKNNSVKQSPSLKKGDVCMWQQKKTNRMLFGTVIEDYRGGGFVRLMYKDQAGKKSPTAIEIDRVKALTFFDDDKYTKMGEVGAKAIEKKLLSAKVGYYTYLNKKDQERTRFYDSQVKELENKLKTAAPGLPEEGAVSESLVLWGMVAEEADVLIKGKDQVGAWSYIVKSYKELTKDEAAYKSHILLISELLEGRYKGNSDRKTVRAATIDLGKEILRIMGEKYRPIPIGDMKSYTTETPAKDVSSSAKSPYPAHMVINEAEAAPAPAPDPAAKREVDKEITDCAEKLCPFVRVILSLNQDKRLAASFVNKSGEGVSKSISKMISSYTRMKETRNHVNESLEIARTYGYFLRMLTEADDPDEGSLDDETQPADDDTPEREGQGEGQAQGQGEGQAQGEEKDLIIVAWYAVFRKGEEEEWRVEETEVRQEIGPEKGIVTINIQSGASDPKLDPIIRIVNIFGKAYNLYATDYIPSGRPEGRVSQGTLREYEYIGKGEENVQRGSAGTDYFVPGPGPWAAKKVYDKWQEGVMKILEDKWFRKVLANVKFVSSAEKETGMQQKEQGSDKSSGITLMRFMMELLNLEGKFSKARKTLMLKYFNADLGDDKGGQGDGGPKGKPPKVNDPLPSNEPFFQKYDMINSAKVGGADKAGRELVGKNVTKKLFYSVTIKENGNGKHLLMWCVYTNKDIALFLGHISDKIKKEESILTAKLPNQTPPLKLDRIQETGDLNGINSITNKKLYMMAIKKADLDNFYNGKTGLSILFGEYDSARVRSGAIQARKCDVEKIGILIRNDDKGGLWSVEIGKTVDHLAYREPQAIRFDREANAFTNYTPPTTP